MNEEEYIEYNVDEDSAEKEFVLKLPHPKEIKAILDQYVIGQEEAKKTLSVAVHNHYKRIFGESDDETVIDKSNILMLGNTGTGKTHMIKTIAKILGVPCYIADCTKLTESGYVGSDVESVLSGLLQTCNFNVQLAEMGIVVLDEVDKLSKRTSGQSLTRDVGGEGVQQALLKIVEGDIVGVPPQGGRKHPEQPLINVNTNNILFIAMGAFVGIEDVIAARNKKDVYIGFNQQKKKKEKKSKNILADILPEDLKSFGLIPEMIGRFPVITYTNPLEKKDLIKILTEPKNALVKQYKKLLSMDNVKLSFQDKAIEYIAEIALETNMGARGLRHVMEKVLMDIMYDFSGSDIEEVEIDRKYVSKSIKIRKK